MQRKMTVSLRVMLLGAVLIFALTSDENGWKLSTIQGKKLDIDFVVTTKRIVIFIQKIIEVQGF